ncbi:MAG: hypothetical protein LUQ64_04360 [Methanomicrobiales archaeon]|nr:hypothetical protein [Methanomicrobiales archaeon]
MGDTDWAYGILIASCLFAIAVFLWLGGIPSGPEMVTLLKSLAEDPIGGDLPDPALSHSALMFEMVLILSLIGGGAVVTLVMERRRNLR